MNTLVGLDHKGLLDNIEVQYPITSSLIYMIYKLIMNRHSNVLHCDKLSMSGIVAKGSTVKEVGACYDKDVLFPALQLQLVARASANALHRSNILPARSQIKV